MSANRLGEAIAIIIILLHSVVRFSKRLIINATSDRIRHCIHTISRIHGDNT